MRLPPEAEDPQPPVLVAASSKQIRVALAGMWSCIAAMIVSGVTGFPLPLWLVTIVLLPAGFYGLWRVHVESKVDIELARALIRLHNEGKSPNDLPPHLREHLNILLARMKLNPPQ